MYSLCTAGDRAPKLKQNEARGPCKGTFWHLPSLWVAVECGSLMFEFLSLIPAGSGLKCFFSHPPPNRCPSGMGTAGSRGEALISHSRLPLLQLWGARGSYGANVLCGRDVRVPLPECRCFYVKSVRRGKSRKVALSSQPVTGLVLSYKMSLRRCEYGYFPL